MCCQCRASVGEAEIGAVIGVFKRQLSVNADKASPLQKGQRKPGRIFIQISFQ